MRTSGAAPPLRDVHTPKLLTDMQHGLPNQNGLNQNYYTAPHPRDLPWSQRDKDTFLLPCVLRIETDTAITHSLP
jgi:hypothetical protein